MEARPVNQQNATPGYSGGDDYISEFNPDYPTVAVGINFQPAGFNILSQVTAKDISLTEPYEGFQDNFQPDNSHGEHVEHQLSSLVGGLVFNADPYIQVQRTRLAFPVSLHMPYYGDKKARWDTEAMIYDWWDPLPTDTETYEYLGSYGVETSAWIHDGIRPYVSASLVPWKQYLIQYNGVDNHNAANAVSERNRVKTGEGIGGIFEAGIHIGNGKPPRRSTSVWGSLDLEFGARVMIFEDNVAVGGGMSFGAGVNTRIAE